MKSIEVFAPGRAEVLGNHTDYNEGLTLSIAINVGIKMSGRAHQDQTLKLVSEEMKQEWTGTFDSIEPLKRPGMVWPNYVVGIAQALQEKGKKLKGGDLTISSTLPREAGLSSSAALGMAAGLAFQQMSGFDMDPLELARAGQWAEHHFTGVQCGLLDQVSVLMSRHQHLTFIDHKSMEIRHIPLPEGWIFVMANSGVKHLLNNGEYNKRRKACESVVKALGLSSLREITPGELEAKQDEVEPRAFRRAMHPVNETYRVAQAVSCLASGNMKGLGRLMFDSHQSSMEYFENSCKELDFLVEVASQHEACIGARLSGGGFGGSTINLVRESQSQKFVDDIKQAYEIHYHREPALFITEACDGAQKA